ncbi:MAG: GNAT family N-acetyltransferase [Clostridiales bacterium]|jgi:RimJ/RimL family protein N-acetyltransferase|nr:GNAT family N-acetyltransferase [Clostridiales bacterium]
MLIKDDDLTIRSATAKDAALLGRWWRNGLIMAHAGFPKGLDITDKKIARDLSCENAKIGLYVLIVEMKGMPVGEMSYRLKGEFPSIGIKICNSHLRGKGYGTRLVNMLVGELFDRGFQKILVDADLENVRAQKTYERVGFIEIARHENSWKDQLGQPRGHIDYELTRASWQKMLDSPETMGYNGWIKEEI